MLFLTVISLLLVPGQASAQPDPDHPYRVEAVVVGGTDPDPDPMNHSLGVNRVAGESEFDGLEINAVIDCEDEVVLAQTLTLVEGGSIRYRTDDDITDGAGELNAGDNSQLTSSAATEFRVPPGATDTDPARVTVRILEGRFHRLLNVVEVDLRLDIRVVRNPGTGDEELVCETGDGNDSRIPEVRLTLLIVGPDADGDGFQLVGEARRHGDVDGDRTSVARTACETVGPHSTRVAEPTTTVGPPPSVTFPKGRNDFHPCGPQEQG